jgi:5,10-methenyltetrahydromethanopterin hydrogenase
MKQQYQSAFISPVGLMVSPRRVKANDLLYTAEMLKKQFEILGDDPAYRVPADCCESAAALGIALLGASCARDLREAISADVELQIKRLRDAAQDLLDAPADFVQLPRVKSMTSTGGFTFFGGRDEQSD